MGPGEYASRNSMSKKDDKLGKKTRCRKKEKEEREQERTMETIRQK